MYTSLYAHKFIYEKQFLRLQIVLIINSHFKYYMLKLMWKYIIFRHYISFDSPVFSIHIRHYYILLFFEWKQFYCQSSVIKWHKSAKFIYLLISVGILSLFDKKLQWTFDLLVIIMLPKIWFSFVAFVGAIWCNEINFCERKKTCFRSGLRWHFLLDFQCKIVFEWFFDYFDIYGLWIEIRNAD